MMKKILDVSIRTILLLMIIINIFPPAEVFAASGTTLGDLRREYEKLLAEKQANDSAIENAQNEIAEMMGISRSYVSRIETKAISKLAKEFKE